MNQQDANPGLNIDPEGARKELSRILASKAFRQADRLKRFLNFIVRETLEGRAEGLKEFSVGIEVFDRDPTFDPRSDPIVRVQARRLRAQLGRYYAEEAEPGEIILEVPKGRYAAVFKSPTVTRPVLAMKSASPLLINRNTVLALPFSDYSPGGDQKHFCAGLKEEIIHRLAEMAEVRLVVCNSAPRSDGEWNLQEEAIRANASLVVAGSVRKSDGLVRVTSNLIDAVSGCYLWSMTIDGSQNSPFTIQEEVAQAVAKKLETEMALGQVRKSFRPPAQNRAAVNFYTQGRYHLDQRTEESLRKAAGLFEKAVAEDGQYAQAYSGLADAYGLLSHYGVLAPAEVWTKTASNAALAVLCDEHSVEAHTSLAHVKATQDWDWSGAEAEFQRAISLDSRYSRAHHWYALSFLAPVGRLDDAREEMLIAQTLDPISAIISRDLARIYYYMRDYERALEECDRTIELDPHFTPAYALLGLVQELRGEFEEAAAAFQCAIQLSPRSPSLRAELGHSLALSGKGSEARRILNGIREVMEQRYVSPFHLALLFIALGEIEEGFRWLEKAFDDRCFDLISLKIDPRLDPVKTNPQFIALAGRLGLPEL